MFFLRLLALSGCFLKCGIYAGKEKRYLLGCCAGLGVSWLGVLKIALMQLVASFLSSFLLRIQTIFLLCNNMGIVVLSYDLRT